MVPHSLLADCTHINSAPPPLQQHAKPLPQYPASAPTSLLDAFNADNIAAMRSSSSYAQLNPVLREEEMEGVPQFRFKLQEDPAEVAHHSYSEVALVPLAHSFGAKGQLSSRSGLSLQEAMKVAPAMSKEEEDNAAHPYFNLSKVRGWVRGGGGGGAPPLSPSFQSNVHVRHPICTLIHFCSSVSVPVCPTVLELMTYVA